MSINVKSAYAENFYIAGLEVFYGVHGKKRLFHGISV